jgi:hypothetical protein
LLRNDILWRQKSLETWLREGDRNSKFFLLSTIIRRRRNNIDAIKDDSGHWILKSNEIGNHFLIKFKELFKEEMTEFPENLANLIPHSLSKADTKGLCRVPTM